MVQEEKQPVDLFGRIDEVRRQLTEKEALVFLDYDGTLTPIVDTPDLAVLAPEMRETIGELVKHYKVSIVSGRATDDVRGKVRVGGIFYAGSHGFEIVDPEGNVTISDKARDARPLIDEVHAKLSGRLGDIDGALVENVKYTISVHYRLVSSRHYPKIENAVEDILAQYPGLYKTSGKMVYEVRPKIDWHKGKAVEWIMNVLDYDPARHLAVYIGDDVTDEDAFAALDGKGFGILVAEEARASKAAYMVRDTQDVRRVLETLIRIKEERPRG